MKFGGGDLAKKKLKKKASGRSEREEKVKVILVVSN